MYKKRILFNFFTYKRRNKYGNIQKYWWSNRGGYNNDVIGVEQQIGIITINGTTYTKYRQFVDFGALLNATDKFVNHGISLTSINQILKIDAIAWGSGTAVSLPFVSSANPDNVINIYSTLTYIDVRPSFDATAFTSCYVTIEYYR